MARLQGSKQNQADQTSQLCVLFMRGKANKGELSPGGSELIGQDRRTSQVMSTGKSNSTPCQFLIFIWPSVSISAQHWANALKLCNPRAPQTHTHMLLFAICLQWNMLHCSGKQEWVSGHRRYILGDVLTIAFYCFLSALATLSHTKLTYTDFLI